MQTRLVMVLTTLPHAGVGVPEGERHGQGSSETAQMGGDATHFRLGGDGG
mgnify:CR=1 FL=1|jgi:hypothetical protein